MEVVEINTRIGALFRIYRDPMTAGTAKEEPLLLPQDMDYHDDRIGGIVTTIRIPESLQVAQKRYEYDYIFKKAVQIRSHSLHTNPHDLMDRKGGKEIRVRNEKLGIELYKYNRDDNTPISDDETNSPPNRLTRLLKFLTPW